MDILKDITVERKVVRTETKTYHPITPEGFKYLVLYAAHGRDAGADATFCCLSDAMRYIRAHGPSSQLRLRVINLETGEEVAI